MKLFFNRILSDFLGKVFKWNRKALWIFWISLILTTCFQLPAQQFSVHLAFDTTEISIGEQNSLRITIEKVDSLDFSFPVLRDSIPPQIELLDVQLSDSSLISENRWRIQYTYRITSFDSGTWTIPSIPVAFRQGNLIDTLHTMPLSLNVHTFLIDPSKEIFDIKSPIQIPVTLIEILFWSGLVILVLMLITIIVLLIKKKRQKIQVPSRKKSLDPPDWVAIKALDLLKEKKLWQQGFSKEYYIELTEIVRRYIEDRFGIPALEQTSAEILNAMRFTSFDDESTYKALEQLLVLSDLVKFAKELPLPDENEANLLNAYVFVNRTKPTYTVPEEGKTVENDNQGVK